MMLTTQKNFIKQPVVISVLTLVFFSSLITIPKVSALQDVVDTMKEDKVSINKGDLISLKVYQLTRIAISNPGIIDVVNADEKEILIIGRTVGETPIFIWDENGKRKIMARVMEEELDTVTQRIQELLAAADIKDVDLKKNNYEGKIIATGHILQQKKDEFEKIISQFSANLINMVKEEEDLVQIDVQISELNTTLTKELGFDWTTGSGSQLSFGYQEVLPTFAGRSVEDWFKLGRFDRTSAILATVDLLIQEGKARTLSKPSILVSNGEEASFHVGGEIPVRTTTTSTGGASVQQNVSFKQYGIDLTVTPEIKDGKVDMILQVSVRDIDASNAVGDDVAFTNRQANTKVLLDDKQTIVIAGLIKQQQGETIKRVPFLSSIPLVGFLFRHTETPTPDQDQELVISLTPTIVRQKRPGRDIGPEPNRAFSEQVKEEKLPEVSKLEEAENAGANETPEYEESQTDQNLNNIDLPEFAEQPVAVPEQPAAVAALEEEPSEKTITLAPYGDVDNTTNVVAVPAAPSTQPQESPKATDEGSTNAIATYVQAIQKRISNTISYPYEARENNWQGTVKLNLVLEKDGSLKEAKVEQSSGYDVFDKDAVNTALILAPFDPFSSEIDLEELVVTIPIVYSQEAVFGDSE